ncbi:MAG: glycosyltransferase family 2 protein [Chloroflexota bacterium]
MSQKTLPRISIITPSYNRAHYLERTIQSIIGQNYPNLEYIIIDGGSTDGTVDVIKQYEQYITDWVSEPDEGMYHAIQKGFERSTGEIMGWLNSDDMYFDWTFATISKMFNLFPQVEWLTTNQYVMVDEHDAPLTTYQVAGISSEGILRGEHLPIAQQAVKFDYVMQESTFWRRSLWEESGASLDLSLKYAGDAELWLRFAQHAQLHEVSIPLAKFRKHPDQITSMVMATYEAEVEQLLSRYVQPYHPMMAWLRKTASKHTPFRIRGLAVRLGLMHRSYRINYNMYSQQWEIKPRYY